MKIIELVPERVRFDQFWVEIRKRNRWLVMLRYGAVAMLATLIFGIYIVGFFWHEFKVNTFPLWIITFLILLYNIFLHWFWVDFPNTKYGVSKFHDLHFSLIQIILDLISLMFFIYYTGGVESPFYIFFIFHVIIATMFMSGEVAGFIVAFQLLFTVTGSVLEFNNIIPHHSIVGLFQVQIYDKLMYVISFFTFNGIALFISVYLANSVAKELYLRERDLTTAYKELEDAEKSKSRYVQTIVHDLKTPIAASLTYLSMILEGTLGDIPESFNRPLERIKIRLNNAIQTINDILRITQLKLETSIEDVTNIGLSDLIEEIYADMRILIRSKNIEYNFIGGSKNDITIQAEPRMFKLVLSNLISNACKYTGENGKIEISLEEIRDDVLISVADNGIGIPEKERDKVFQTFYRTSISKTKGIEGTGLGLSIVYEIIQKYHGKIEVVSPSYLSSGEDCPGTQFIVTMPRQFSVI